MTATEAPLVCLRRHAAILLLVVGALVNVPLAEAAPSIVGQLGGTDGSVVTAIEYGSCLYVGGYFSHAGPATGSCVELDAVSGATLGAFPQVSGPVRAIVSDGHGGWFIGGSFTHIDGRPHGSLAHVGPSQELFDWDPAPDAPVLALAVSGDTLFVGGAFGSLWGAVRRYIGAFEVKSGALLDSLPRPDGRVLAMLAADGKLFVGCESRDPSSTTLGALCSYDIPSWSVRAWSDSILRLSVYGAVQALALERGRLFFGGRFGLGDSPTVVNAAAVDIGSGVVEPWRVEHVGPTNDRYHGDPEITALAVQDTSVYVGGHFSSVSGVRHGGLVKVGFPSGIVSPANIEAGPWEGELARAVTSMALLGNELYVAGWFSSLGDSSRGFLASLDLATDQVTAWAPYANSGVLAIAAADNRVLAGGRFEGVGAEWAQRRDGLAAFDLSTGRLKPWNPSPSGLGVEKLVATDGRIYVGGYFDALGGEPRYCLGAVDTLSGHATNWDPGCTGPVFEIVAYHDTLYVGGAFDALAGQPRGYVGAFRIDAGTLLDWAPQANSAVFAILRDAQRVFIGGDFSDFNGVRRPGVVAVDAKSGALEPFDCHIRQFDVSALALSGDTLYLGGGFLGIGGTSQSHVAAVNANTGTLIPLWAADPTGFVTDVVKIDTVLYIAGSFGIVSGHRRVGLAALSGATGEVLDWEPQVNSTVWGLSSSGRTLFAGGSFDAVLGFPRPCFAAIRLDAPPVPPRPLLVGLALAAPWPNPAADRLTIEWSAPTNGPVTVEIFDVQGRLIASPAGARSLGAGPSRITVPVAALRAGVYLCRVQAGPQSATRKFFVQR